VALRLAATRPDRVAGLILVNTVAFDDMPGRDVRTLQRNTARFAFRLGRGVFGAAPLLAPVLKGSVTDPSHMPERLVARYVAPFVGPDGVSHLLDLARSLRVEEVDEIDLAAVAAPTLVVWGEGDPWLDRDIPARLLHAVPGSRLARLPKVGRLVPEEAPDALARLIVDHARLAAERAAELGRAAESPSAADLAEARGAAAAFARGEVVSGADPDDRRRRDRGGVDRRQETD
jgi:pimeloyl-ACP methyl ester carboxylesterase